MAPDIIINSRPQLLRYLADELDDDLYAQFDLLDEQALELLLTTRADETLAMMLAEQLLLQEITDHFFSDQKGFKREFHLILFPFFTSFVNTIEVLEIDSASILNKNPLVPHFNIISPAAKQQLLHVVDAWVIHFSNLDELKDSAGERFIWFLSSFFDKLSMIAQLPSQKKAYTQLKQAINQAFSPLLSIAEPWDENLIVEQLSTYLEELVSPLLPKKEAFVSRLSFLSRRKYLGQLTALLEEERERYQEQLSSTFKPIYNQCCNDLEGAWTIYMQQFNQRFSRINNYLSNLKYQQNQS